MRLFKLLVRFVSILTKVSLFFRIICIIKILLIMRFIKILLIVRY